jgi:hypothetical protein
MNPEIEKRITELKNDIKKYLPMLKLHVLSQQDFVIFHQDAFAADYQDHEYLLLGKAIKYFGLQRKEIRIIGQNRETLK